MRHGMAWTITISRDAEYYTSPFGYIQTVSGWRSYKMKTKISLPCLVCGYALAVPLRRHAGSQLSHSFSRCVCLQLYAWLPLLTLASRCLSSHSLPFPPSRARATHNLDRHSTHTMAPAVPPARILGLVALSVLQYTLRLLCCRTERVLTVI